MEQASRDLPSGIPETRIRKDELFSRLPPEWPDSGLSEEIDDYVRRLGRAVVALDDDPTGVQTVHGIKVLTGWAVSDLRPPLEAGERLFFVLTNTRSYPLPRAVEINEEIAANLTAAGRASGTEFAVVSRSDSTLRGHYPGELEALGRAISSGLGRQFDGQIIVPAFFEGGRFTIGDIHWVAEGEWLVPAAQTEFARDSAFGYRHSDLRRWVEEKTGGRVKAPEVVSVSLEDIRRVGPERVEDVLKGVDGGRPVVVNAASYVDLRVFTLGLLRAESRGKNFLYRSAASFVKVRAGIPDRGPLTRTEVYGGIASPGGGGLVIAGSHVKKTTEQLDDALALGGLVATELSVPKILDQATREQEIVRAWYEAESGLAGGSDVLVYSSREVIAARTEEANLDISRSVSTALVELVRRLRCRPRFIIAKGGITSSDVATRGLGVKSALVLGQAYPGVPVWRLGPETRFPDLPYVVFPGNVGQRGTLADVIRLLR